MVLLLRKPQMAARGRPKKPDDERTATVRVRKDLAAMLTWITRIRQKDAADVLDAELRPFLVGEFTSLYPAILAIKNAEDAARLATGQPPTEALPVVLGVTHPLNAHDATVSEYPEAGPSAEGEPKAEPKTKAKPKKPKGEK
jgi:hypothetical protein